MLTSFEKMLFVSTIACLVYFITYMTRKYNSTIVPMLEYMNKQLRKENEVRLLPIYQYKPKEYMEYIDSVVVDAYLLFFSKTLLEITLDIRIDSHSEWYGLVYLEFIDLFNKANISEHERLYGEDSLIKIFYNSSLRLQINGTLTELYKISHGKLR